MPYVKIAHTLRDLLFACICAADAGMGVVFSITAAAGCGVFCGAWQVQGAFPLTNFFDASSTEVNITVTGLVDINNNTQPEITTSATVPHW